MHHSMPIFGLPATVGQPAKMATQRKHSAVLACNVYKKCKASAGKAVMLHPHHVVDSQQVSVQPLTVTQMRYAAS